MAILGIGVDVVALERVAQVLARHPERFASRVFTEREQVYFQPEADVSRIAARFAVKEAVSKALGCGIGKIGWRDIETTSQESGAPEVRLFGRALALAEKKGVKTVHCSISHEKQLAVAMIILEG